MRLSEAIRLGAISCKWGKVFVFNPFDGSRCTLGMACYAVGRHEITDMEDVAKLWPWIKECLPCGSLAITRIWVDNDDGNKTPLQIADWVESLERERGMWDAKTVQEDARQEHVRV